MKIRNYITPLVFFIPLQFVSAQTELMQANMENSLESVWKKKEIFDSKPIDNCERLENWESGGEAQISLCNTRQKEGTKSIKFSTPVVSADSSATYPSSYVGMKFNGANWESFNRISVWIYAENKNAECIYLSMFLNNNGKEKVPNKYKKKGRHFFRVETNKWNNILWEIPLLPRDEVASLSFVYVIDGKRFAGLGDRIDFYIDEIELQNVNADYEEGWQVAPGKIAFSHTGYSTGGSKSALANNLDTDDFFIIDANSGEKVLSKKIEKTPTRFGEFQLMDFSELRSAGEYKIQAGEISTRSFLISRDPWTETIWKNLNFWRSERCGQEVPGIHDNCHRDVYVEHNGKQIIINGGWHAASDLSQFIYDTGDAIFIMLDLAEKIETRNPELYSALVEEAKWGLEWMLKTRFGKGYRQKIGAISKYTDGVIGTGDDLSFEAINQPYDNFLSALAISKAALFFNEIDQTLSDKCKNAAIEDWEYATRGITELDVELCGNAIIASVNLFKLTGDSLYLSKAIEWAEIMTQSQHQTYPDWDIPLVGFFYVDPSKKQVLRYNPNGQDQAPIIALEALCQLLPDHTNWIDWYAAIALYAEYIKKSAELSNPFQMIPQSIYNVDETHTPNIYGWPQSTLANYKKHEENKSQYKEQVKNGLPLGNGNYLRTFPVWYSHRGSANIQLSQAKGLSVASHLRNDIAGINLAEKQLQWVVGRNPFSQSTMYGEGYDFAPLYSVGPGPIVGSIPVGIQTNGSSDIPNWPASNCYIYKEIWTLPASRWLWLLRDVIGAARVTGIAGLSEETVEICELISGDKVNVKFDEQAEFYTELAAGQYQFKSENLNKNLTLLPGRDYEIDFNKTLNYSVSKRIVDKGEIEITVSATGKGMKKFELRGFNISIENPVRTIQMGGKRQEVIRWKVQVSSSNRPWIAVVIANDELSTMQEIHSVF